MSINTKSVGYHQCHAKRHSICFFSTAISKITTEIFVKICWQLKTLIRTWKCTRCIMQMSYLYASDFPFKSFQTRSTCRNNTKKCLGKELWRVLVVDESTDHDKPHFELFFLPQYQRQRKLMFFWTRAEKGIARHIDASSVVWVMGGCWDLVIFDWFVLSMRMQVILDSSFSRPGSAPIWGGKEGEFRDWTTLHFTSSFYIIKDEVGSLMSK